MQDEIIPYEIITFKELKECIDETKPLMYDSETIGKYGKIRLAQFYQEGWDKVLLLENPDPLFLVSILSKVHFVCHNVHYDITTIQRQLGMQPWVPENFSCTFLLSRLHYYTQDGFSLDKVMTYALGFDPYAAAGLEKTEMQGKDWNVPILSKDQITYACIDVYYLPQVYNQVKEQTDNINYTLDLLSTKYALDYQNNGLPIEEDIIRAKYAENLAEVERIGVPINVNSFQQVRKYINSNLSNDEGLALLSFQGNERAANVRTTRGLLKANSFLSKWLETQIDGNIYGTFKYSPRTGRSSSDEQNLQQLPRDLKTCFGVEENGDTVLIYSDFPQIQLRGVCVVANDKAMEKLFRAGEDLHNYVAQLIFGDNFTKDQRQICKTANFGLLFGAGVAVFSKILLTTTGIKVSDEELSRIKKKWLSLWKDVANWQKEGIKAYKKKQAWETPLGRRYTARLMTDQLAMQIQGFEAEVAKLTIHYMLPKLAKLSTDIKLVNFIHDSYIFTCPNDEVLYKEASKIIASCMEEAWFEMSKSVIIQDLPMPCKVRVGWNWGKIENDEFIYELTTKGEI